MNEKYNVYLVSDQQVKTQIEFSSLKSQSKTLNMAKKIVSKNRATIDKIINECIEKKLLILYTIGKLNGQHISRQSEKNKVHVLAF